MTAQVIYVDFKKRQVVKPESTPDESAGLDIAQNKKMINDLKAMLDSVVDQLDLYSGIILIPNKERDLYVKINGTDIEEVDIKAIGRIHTKLRQSNVKP